MIWRGVEISTETNLDGSTQLVFRWESCDQETWRMIDHLAHVLAGNDLVIEFRFPGTMAELWVSYTDDVDRRIVELVDLLAGIRCSVPRMVQLQLSLDDGGELAERLQAVLPGVSE